MANKLSAIDELTRSAHRHLDEQDECYYFREYTAHAGYQFSDTNQLIFNFKKPMDKKSNHREWQYKEKAIETIAKMFSPYAKYFADNQFILVPIPPSKPIGHPEYDDRVVRMLRSIQPNQNLDIRELVVTRQERQSFHDGGQRLSPRDLKKLLTINQDEVTDVQEHPFAIIDDVLTTGSNFKAVSMLLRETFPGVGIAGFFVARCVFSE